MINKTGIAILSTLIGITITAILILTQYQNFSGNNKKDTTVGSTEISREINNVNNILDPTAQKELTSTLQSQISSPYSDQQTDTNPVVDQNR